MNKQQCHNNRLIAKCMRYFEVNKNDLSFKCDDCFKFYNDLWICIHGREFKKNDLTYSRYIEIYKIQLIKKLKKRRKESQAKTFFTVSNS